jgi:hypothetical protein
MNATHVFLEEDRLSILTFMLGVFIYTHISMVLEEVSFEEFLKLPYIFNLCNSQISVHAVFLYIIYNFYF